MVDYIVVGLGLAGIAFCEELQKYNKSFVVIDKGVHGSSEISGGVYNPVILKRFTLAWEADKQLELALPFYKKLEEKLQVKLDHKLPIYRILDSVSEQNLWFESSDKPHLQKHLSDKLIQNANPSFEASFSMGEIKNSGRIDVKILLEKYIEFLQAKNILIREAFDFEALEIETGISYKNHKASKIVFAEGYGMKENPFFSYLPLVGTKGELITIEAKGLNVTEILKTSVVIIPLGNDTYRVGATYNFDDKTLLCTQEAKIELTGQLDKVLRCPYKILDHQAAIRPTVLDRRPLLGIHKRFKNIALFNGLGTRGVMLAPYLAPLLFGNLEHQKPIPKDIDLKRYERLSP